MPKITEQVHICNMCKKEIECDGCSKTLFCDNFSQHLDIHFKEQNNENK